MTDLKNIYRHRKLLLKNGQIGKNDLKLHQIDEDCNLIAYWHSAAMNICGAMIENTCSFLMEILPH